MKLLFISADAAVDAVSTAKELMKITDLILYENSMDDPMFELFASLASGGLSGMKDAVLEEYARTDCCGFIFTYPKTERRAAEIEHFDHIARIFEKVKPDTKVYFVSLTLTQEEDKPDDYRCWGYGLAVDHENRMKICFADQTCDKVALMIKQRFRL